MLVSPGQQITITDESQYVPGAVGTVPLVILATEQDKVNPAGATAAGTIKTNAGKLQAYTSQRELASAFGYPTFKQSSAGTPLHGDERNEYGLMAAYSTLGVGNQIFCIRADIDLADLVPSAIRPTGIVSDGTYWLDLSSTDWGVTKWNATTSSFTKQTVTNYISSVDLTDNFGINYPVTNVGDVGSYGATLSNNSVWNVFKKSAANEWNLVGSDAWARDMATVAGINPSPVILANVNAAAISINAITITVGSTSVDYVLSDVVAAINAAAVPGVSARIINNRLELIADSLAASQRIVIANSTGTPLSALGIAVGTYYIPKSQFGTYIQIPAWRSSDSQPRPTGSVYVKTTVTGAGANVSVKKFNSGTETWTTQAAGLYESPQSATYGIDPAGGGFGITTGSIWVRYNISSDGIVSYKPMVRRTQGATKIVAKLVGVSPFTSGNSFTLAYSSIGSDTLTTATITISGINRASFVSAILAAGINEVTATVETSGAISLTHKYGGVMVLTNGVGIPVNNAGFDTTVSGVQLTESGSYEFTNFDNLTYTYSLTEPTQKPVDGKLWYYASATEVDIMINTTTGWKGYQNEANDARGYDLSATDPKGVIVSASKPTTQTDNTGLVAGDIWLDTSDLENWPALSRYTGTRFEKIDNTDQVGQSGIVFADARWDSDGSADPVSDAIPTVISMLTSDYVDADAPDARLYPRGTLLFNTRRSGYNVKRYVRDYFDVNQGTWVSASGLKDNGSMNAGRQAQRNMVVSAMKAAIDGNTAIREDQFVFNLIAAPGYPELISNMVSLNNDRANTGFVIGDTPFRLTPNVVDLVNWSNNADNATGLTTNDPYLAVYYPGAATTNDVQGNAIVVPSSHVALRTFLHNDNVSYQWFAPAGTRRGLVDNATSVGYIDPDTGEYNPIGVNQGLRDALYVTRINPITNIPGIGLVIWGQKTRNPTASSLDRVNVARLVNYIRSILATVGNGFLFEPNDKITRDQIKTIISGAINDLVSKRGIYDYLVVCDESNNTPTRIARNELYVDVAVEPMKGVEFIYIPIRLYNPGDVAKLG